MGVEALNLQDNKTKTKGEWYLESNIMSNQSYYNNGVTTKAIRL